MDSRAMEGEIVQSILEPRRGAICVDVRDYGAVAGAECCQTEALQAAIDDVNARGGGRVNIPAGRFLTASLCLRSGVELFLQCKESHLAFVTSMTEADYPLTYVHWEGTPCYNYRPLLYAYGEQDIAVRGEGLLDGQASAENWFAWHYQKEQAWSGDETDLQNKARMLLREMNEQGVSVSQRILGQGYYLRPDFIQIIDCERVVLEGFTIRNSPMWVIHPVRCRHVTLRGVSVFSHGPNNDGCDPESCDGVLIEGNRFDTGDDCISLKSGRDRDGREQNLPCQNVVIRNNLFADGHGGIAIGSEVSGGVRNVVARGNHFESKHLTYALRFKTNARRGGILENIALCDSVVTQVAGAAVHGTMLYEDGPNGFYLPTIRNITIERLKAHGGTYGIFLEAFEQVPITGLTLRNIRIDGVRTPMHAVNWKGAVLEDVIINGIPFPSITMVRIAGVPSIGARLAAKAQGCGEPIACRYEWYLRDENGHRHQIARGEEMTLEEGRTGQSILVRAIDDRGNAKESSPYRILLHTQENRAVARLRTRAMLDDKPFDPQAPLTRRQLCRMVAPLLEKAPLADLPADVRHTDRDAKAFALALGARLLTQKEGKFLPEGTMTRQEMATVAMQCCGINYENASTTMPECADADDVLESMGTNVARSLYYGFMSLDEECKFTPARVVTLGEGIEILSRVADNAGR